MRMLASGFLIVLLAVADSSAGGLNQAAFRVKIVDEEGQPVTNATVFAGFLGDKSGGVGLEEKETFTKQTDSNGVCAFQGRYDGPVAWKTWKDGYYETEGPRPQFTNVTMLGKMEPWDKLYEATLRKIVNPIPMYSRDLSQMWPELEIPEFGKPFGFDLISGDWVAPHGKGETADFIIQMDVHPSVMEKGYYERYPRAVRHMDIKLSVSFSNPDDGIQFIYEPQHGGSSFRLPRFAPENGYQTNYVSEYYVGLRGHHNDMGREDQNYLFRTRAKRNERGEIVSSLYGKISAPIRYRSDGKKGVLSFFYFMNPKPNDRNLEFGSNILEGGTGK